MKGTLQKTIEASTLACRFCRHFRDSDPDIFYCVMQRLEFPGLCDQYQTVGDGVNDLKEWTATDEI